VQPEKPGFLVRKGSPSNPTGEEISTASKEDGSHRCRDATVLYQGTALMRSSLSDKGGEEEVDLEIGKKRVRAERSTGQSKRRVKPENCKTWQGGE
jgi:hypothetical protein